MKTKTEKAPGPDSVKSDLYNNIRKWYFIITEEEETSDSWKTSNTTLIQK